MSIPRLPLKETLESLPPVFASSSSLREQIRKNISTTISTPILVVLDDDPTGTQTCHDINVLTTWSINALATELASTSAGYGFFILTNSRALHPYDARILTTEICNNLKQAGKQADKEFEIVLRSDSTLRGHFPLEVEAVEDVLGQSDVWILAPFFLQGGRYTIDDVHYVAENGILVPAGETPFAKDATFGYKSSNLRDWIVEKTANSRHAVDKQHIFSFHLTDLRQQGPDYVSKELQSRSGNGKPVVFIVNAADEADMDVVILGILQAKAKGLRVLYRTGAAFVSARLGLTPIPPISPTQLSSSFTPSVGGLVIAGSYVPKTTAQLEVLTSRLGNSMKTIVIHVQDLLDGNDVLQKALSTAEKDIASGRDVLVMTSRDLITGANERESLDIGSVIARILVQFLQQIKTRPRYLIAKGGITSSDMATQGLRMKKALVMGQAAPGVPLWRCDEESCKWPGLPFVVFPGNVGGEDALFELVKAWRADVYQ